MLILEHEVYSNLALDFLHTKVLATFSAIVLQTGHESNLAFASNYFSVISPTSEWNPRKERP
jgi:hypothetical protein